MAQRFGGDACAVGDEEGGAMVRHGRPCLLWVCLCKVYTGAGADGIGLAGIHFRHVITTLHDIFLLWPAGALATD
jgi:hypothetical protein